MEVALNKKIYYHDTDAGGVVYYANYLKYLEEARTEFLVSKGLDLNALSREGCLFCVADVNIKYKAPAKYSDELEVYTRIEKLGNVYLDFFQEIKRADALITQSTTRLVCIDACFKPRPIPEKISKLLA